MNEPKLAFLKDNLMLTLKSNPSVRYNYIFFHSILSFFLHAYDQTACIFI